MTDKVTVCSKQAVTLFLKPNPFVESKGARPFLKKR